MWGIELIHISRKNYLKKLKRNDLPDSFALGSCPQPHIMLPDLLWWTGTAVSESLKGASVTSPFLCKTYMFCYIIMIIFLIARILSVLIFRIVKMPNNLSPNSINQRLNEKPELGQKWHQIWVQTRFNLKLGIYNKLCTNISGIPYSTEITKPAYWNLPF